MVAVINSTESPVALEAWRLQMLANYGEPMRARLDAALTLAKQFYQDSITPEGEPWLLRALGAAMVLSTLHLDADSILATILMGAPQMPPEMRAQIESHFGQDILALTQGAARMGEIHLLEATTSKEAQAQQLETLRKMLLAMVQDIRVVLIKLAERTQTLRYLSAGSADPTVDGASLAAKNTAREVLDLFAPLANRLGVWQIKWELEDLSLRILEPATYRQIAKSLDERRLDRERYIEDVKQTLRDELTRAGIKGEVTGRPKHIYSIWKKLQRKQAGIDQLFDIRAVRIIVPDLRDCYTALGLVHHLWTPLPKEFDDYIARPKANNYRSLHTAVIGPDGKALEVQIRTREMHQHSEYGVAAHWRYKEGAATEHNREAGFDEKIAWLRHVLEWKDEATQVLDDGALIDNFRGNLFDDIIYVFTPQGRVIELPKGATPVDFAYHLHSNLGHRCRGAKVDGQMVPLNHELKTGQRVEVVTVKEGGPSRDWPNPALGYCHSQRARSKVRQYFKQQQLAETIAQGRAELERDLARLGHSALKLEEVAKAAGEASLEAFCTAIARDEINSRAIEMAIRAVANNALAVPPLHEDKVHTYQSRANVTGSGVLVQGVDKLMTVLAKCCKPAPPDPIIGFVSRGRGVMIHRQSCQNVSRLAPERLIATSWGGQQNEVFPADIEVSASDRQGLLRDISEIMSREKVNVTAVNTASKKQTAKMLFTCEVKGVDHLQRVLGMIAEVEGVQQVRRR